MTEQLMNIDPVGNAETAEPAFFTSFLSDFP